MTCYAALNAIGDWPLDDYISERLTTDGGFARFNPTWTETVRERICYVAPDDDINYTLVGYLVLSEYGLDFTRDDLARTWLSNLVPACTYGPERTILTRLTQASITKAAVDFDTLADELNPGEEQCGAMIRADAYGYACPGRPQLAAELAWRDAEPDPSPHRHLRDDVRGGRDRDRVRRARPTRSVPHRGCGMSRSAAGSAESVEFGLEAVAASTDWLDGYRRINARLGKLRHCRIHQEVGDAGEHAPLGGVASATASASR